MLNVMSIFHGRLQNPETNAYLKFLIINWNDRQWTSVKLHDVKPNACIASHFVGTESVEKTKCEQSKVARQVCQITK